jgi:uncharacterized protein
MERIGTVETICRYPVKSMAGEEVAQAFVGFAGVMGDRVFAFVRTPGPKGFPWHTGREQEDLILFRPHFRESGGTTLPPDIEESFKMAPGRQSDISHRGRVRDRYRDTRWPNSAAALG